MKLHDFDTDIGVIRRNMGADIFDWSTSSHSSSIIDNLADALRKNLEFELDDIQLDEFENLDYFVTEDGQRFLVYIREQSGSFKYHLKMCQHLRDRKSKKTLTNRYVATAQKTNEFSITNSYVGATISRVKLDVCMFCLGEIRWEDNELGRFHYRLPKKSRLKIVENFNPATYFDKYAKEVFDPNLKQDIHVSLNQYSTMHMQIAVLHKENVNYKCQCINCNIDLKNEEKQKQYIHLHHIDGRKDNYDPKNLLVLCVHCHNNRHHHSVSPSELKIFKNNFSNQIKDNCCRPIA